MQQSIVQPISNHPVVAPVAESTAPQNVAKAQPAAATTPQSTSAKVANPDIINLANNQDLSIETIAREASRIEKKQIKADDGEVVISLH